MVLVAVPSSFTTHVFNIKTSVNYIRLPGEAGQGIDARAPAEDDQRVGGVGLEGHGNEARQDQRIFGVVMGQDVHVGTERQIPANNLNQVFVVVIFVVIDRS